VGLKILHLGDSTLASRIKRILENFPDHIESTPHRTRALALLTEHSFDWIVSAGFQHILPGTALARVAHSCNVHTSLLPWGRGAYPNVWMLAEGEPGGVTLHEMTERIDGGDIYAQKRVDVPFGDTAATLYARLEDAAVALFESSWPRMRRGRLRPKPQPSGGSYHRSAELAALAQIDLEASTTWRTAPNTLRALTFPPYENLIIEDHGKRYHLELKIRELPEE